MVNRCSRVSQTNTHWPPGDRPPAPARCIWSLTGCLSSSADRAKTGQRSNMVTATCYLSCCCQNYPTATAGKVKNRSHPQPKNLLQSEFLVHFIIWILSSRSPNRETADDVTRLHAGSVCEKSDLSVWLKALSTTLPMSLSCCCYKEVQMDLNS